MSNSSSIKQTHTYGIVLIGLFSALTVVFSQISIPIGAVPINLALIAVFTAGGLLGLVRGVLSQVVFILLGMVGLPVFAGFKGGVGVIAGPTGGYIVGFLCIPIIVGLFTKLLGKKAWVLSVSMLIGLLLCYALGTLWFVISTGTDFWSALAVCVFPFAIFDLIKIALSVFLVVRLKRFV